MYDVITDKNYLQMTTLHFRCGGVIERREDGRRRRRRRRRRVQAATRAYAHLTQKQVAGCSMTRWITKEYWAIPSLFSQCVAALWLGASWSASLSPEVSYSSFPTKNPFAETWKFCTALHCLIFCMLDYHKCTDLNPNWRLQLFNTVSLSTDAIAC